MSRMAFAEKFFGDNNKEIINDQQSVHNLKLSLLYALGYVLSDSTSGRLHQHLLGDYTIQRPVHHWSEPVDVYVLFSLRQIRDLVRNGYLVAFQVAKVLGSTWGSLLSEIMPKRIFIILRNKPM